MTQLQYCHLHITRILPLKLASKKIKIWKAFSMNHTKEALIIIKTASLKPNPIKILNRTMIYVKMKDWIL